MKKRYITYMMAAIIGMSSCVEDKGSDFLSPINEIKFSGIEEVYNKISYAEELTITPQIDASLSKIDENQLEYQWFICDGAISGETHTIIGNSKNLDYQLNIPPGEYSLYFQVLDKTTGLKWENISKLKMISQFVRGFYLFGDKEDGICGIDFVSFMEGRDTTVVEDIFTNSLQIKGAQDLSFTGYYDALGSSLWAITESGSYSIEYSSSLSELDIRTNISAENFIFPTIEVARPFKVMGVHPQPIGSSNRNRAANSRVLMTKNSFFAASLYGDPEAYGNPMNRYSLKSTELYEVSPYVFYPDNAGSLTYMMFYDMTSQCFLGLNNRFSSAGYSKKIEPDKNEPFYFDQAQYTPVRRLVYGENGYGNAGRSYALMTDDDNKFYIYGFTLNPYRAVPTKDHANEIDQSVATNFAQAKHYTFFSEQAIILYSVGSELWAYDYNRKDAKMIEDFGSEITFLSMDYHSNDKATDFIVATYSSSEKGIVRKFTIENDQNNITVTPHEKEIWKTNLKVVKVEYKNAAA